MITHIRQLRALILGIGCVTLFSGALAAEKPIPVNRLLKPHDAQHRSPKQDGLHDPANPALESLKDPSQVLQPLVPAKNGNFVNWSRSLEKGLIHPRYDAQDASQQPMPMDLDIVIKVKGSAPDVLFPHKAHLQWLECNNCHPVLFEPKKGANQSSMALILKGESCGKCHGSVAFPINNCDRCHSQLKASMPQSAPN